MQSDDLGHQVREIAHRIAVFVFLTSSTAFFVGFVALSPLSLIAYVMPPWFAHVWAAFAIPTLAMLPVWLIAGAIGMILRPTPKDTTHE